MKNKRISTRAALLAVPLLFFLLSRCSQKEPAYKVITVNGSTFANDLSRTHLNFGSMADSGSYFTALLAREGDLLYLFSELENAPIVFRYSKSDGTSLEISTDTAAMYKAEMNGKLHTLYFYDEADVVEWMDDKDKESFRDLRAIHLSQDAIRDHLGLLEEIAAVKPDPGLLFDDFSDPVLFGKVLSYFDPPWVFLPDADSGFLNNDIVSHLSQVKLLYINGEKQLNYDLLTGLPNLQSLIVENWDPRDVPGLRPGKFSNLRSLCLVNSELQSLSVLDGIRGLRDLALIDCDALTDITGLSGHPALEELSLLSCDTVTDLSPVDGLTKLKSLSLPPAVTQEEFAAIAAGHKRLQALELVGCNNIDDLSPLEGLGQLMSLSIDQDAIDYDALARLEGIGVIVIGQDHFEGPDPGLTALKAALPGTYIVPGGGFCMGSGWILLLLPVILVAAVAVGPVRMKSRAVVEREAVPGRTTPATTTQNL